MKLYCVRHGEANSADVDPDRALSPKGKADIQRLAHYLEPYRLNVPHIMHSSLLRAIQTAEILSEKLNCEEVTEVGNLLDEDRDVQPLLEMIPAWNDDTMLVGHLPFMTKLVSALVVNDQNYYPIINFPPGTIVCLEQYENNRWIINWTLNPYIVSVIEGVK